MTETTHSAGAAAARDLDVRELGGARVLVLGAGVSGPGAVRILDALGAEPVVADSRPEAIARLREALPDGVACEGVDLDRAAELLAVGDGRSSVGLVVTSPGWRPDSPLLVAAVESGVPVWGDVELAWRAVAAELFGPRRTWLAVTGTNGKTTTTSMVAVAARAADDKLATDIVVIDVSDQLVITDCFVLASADNERQVNSVVEEIEDKLREAGHKPLRREGTREGRWALLDYNELVVHVQHVDERDYYSLDRLWKDCPVVEIEGVETSRRSDTAAGGADDSLAPEEPQRDQEL